MNKLCLMLSMVLLGQRALACMGPETKYDISFKDDPGQPSNLVVVLDMSTTDPLKPGAPTTSNREIIDDDGYLSAYLTYVKMIKSAEENNKTSFTETDDGAMIGFLRSQISRFQSYLDSNTKALSETPKDKVALLDLTDAIRKFRDVLNQRPISFKELSEFNNIHWGHRASYKSKTATEEALAVLRWQDLKLPITGRARSLGGCSSSIGSFLPRKIPSEAPAPGVKRPKFSIQ